MGIFNVYLKTRYVLSIAILKMKMMISIKFHSKHGKIVGEMWDPMFFDGSCGMGVSGRQFTGDGAPGGSATNQKVFVPCISKPLLTLMIW